ncbi:MAG: hypothetical protein AAFQ19_03190 [Pseudomonadota bacterium]
MFEGHWRTAIAAGLTLIAAFAVSGYILGHQLGEESGKKDAHTKKYERHAADEIQRTCLRLDPAAEAECVVRVMKTAHEHIRAESDLVAQRNMARWALFMLLATLAIAGITAGGVYYVWRTLGVTRDIGQAQTRAYLTPKILKLSWLPKAGARAEIEIENKGASPTRGVNVSGYLSNKGITGWRDGGELSTDVSGGSAAEVLAGGSGKAYIGWHISGHSSFFKGLTVDGTEFHATIDITWFDVFNKSQTARFHFHRPDGKGVMADLEDPFNITLEMRYWEHVEAKD